MHNFNLSAASDGKDICVEIYEPHSAHVLTPTASPERPKSGEWKILNGHKCILAARSPVFKAMFQSHTRENETGRIEITDISYEVFREVLIYMYSDTISSNTVLDMMADALLLAASKYQVIGLQMTCEDYLSNQINSDNTIEMLILADHVQSSMLKDRNLNFIAKNYELVSQLNGFEKLSTELLNEIAEARKVTLHDNTKTFKAYEIIPGRGTMDF
jgi:hypothetical protein